MHAHLTVLHQPTKAALRSKVIVTLQLPGGLVAGSRSPATHLWQLEIAVCGVTDHTGACSVGSLLHGGGLPNH
jgi:hypothetical protein